MEKLRINMTKLLYKIRKTKESTKNLLPVPNYWEKMENSSGCHKIFKNSPKIEKSIKINFPYGDQ